MSSSPIQVLLIEDNPGAARLLQEMLKESSSFKTELTQFSNMADGLSHLARNAANVVLLDLGLPDANGLAAVRKVHEVAARIALVVLTGLDDGTVATQALTAGAQDYLIKGQIGTQALLRAIRYAIERQRMRVETDEVRKLQLQLRNDFVSMVSHELRTPLTPFAGPWASSMPVRWASYRKRRKRWCRSLSRTASAWCASSMTDRKSTRLNSSHRC